LYSFTPVATDPDGTPLTFKIENRPRWASFDPASGRLHGTPLSVDAGTYAAIEISVTDGVDTAALAPFGVVVLVPNSPPVISGDPPASVEAGSSYFIHADGVRPRRQSPDVRRHERAAVGRHRSAHGHLRRDAAGRHDRNVLGHRDQRH
jgi:hypothetical protein